MEEQERTINHKCVLGVSGPKPMLVNQIVGIGETQKSLDIHLRVPKRKPAIEQIIDVYIKRPCITNVEVLTGKVIVRGYFEAKTMYVACMPSQPVHAVEAKRIRFTAEVPVCNARCGMDADASVFIEYVDYECDHNCRAYWHKQWDRYYKQPKYQHDDCDDDYHHDDECDDECDCDHKPHKKHKHHEDCGCDQGHHYQDGCNSSKKKHHHGEECGCSKKPYHHEDDCDNMHNHHHHDECDCPPKKKPRKCCREFDVSIVLKVTAKVMSCREIMLYPQMPQYPVLPFKPKG